MREYWRMENKLTLQQKRAEKETGLSLFPAGIPSMYICLLYKEEKGEEEGVLLLTFLDWTDIRFI